MNSSPILKIEYKLTIESAFSVLDAVPESGNLKESAEITSAGVKKRTEIDFSIAGISESLSDEINALNTRKAYFQITDVNGIVYTVGTTAYRARLNAQLEAGGAPGSFSGYRCMITLVSPSGCTFQ